MGKGVWPAVLVAAMVSTAMQQTASAASAKNGKEVYDTYCIVCHGNNMVNSGARAYDLRKFPLNQKKRFVESVEVGKDKMPAWRDVLTAEEILDLWAYVRTRGK